jgi:DNA-binding NarL/FixJ family response regulator
MKILYFDANEILLPSFASGLQLVSGCEVLTVHSLEEGLQAARDNLASIHLVLVTLSSRPEYGLQFLRNLRELSDGMMFDCPRFLVLTSYPLSLRYPGYLKRFQVIGARCILHSDDEAAYEEVRQMMTDLRYCKSWPTLLLHHGLLGTVSILAGPARALHWNPGPRLLPLLVLLARSRQRGFSTGELANALAISVHSVKIYIQRLRQDFDRIRTELGIQMPGKDVVWTERRPGGFVHGLCANIIWDK